MWIVYLLRFRELIKCQNFEGIREIKKFIDDSNEER